MLTKTFWIFMDLDEPFNQQRDYQAGTFTEKCLGFESFEVSHSIQCTSVGIFRNMLIFLDHTLTSDVQ